MQQHMLIATVFLTLLAGGLTWWMLKLQLSPLLAAARMLAAQSDTPHLLQPLPIPRQDEIGELIGSFNRLLDTLAQREKGLKESEAFKNTILNSVAAEIAVVDRNGVIQAVNERWRRFSLENGVQPGQPVPHTEVGGNYLTACGVGADFTSKKL
jgi:PAS domain-containing protein